MNANVDARSLIGSKSNSQSTANDVTWKLAQFGDLCFFLKVDFPISNQMIATSLVQNGFSVSVDYYGDVSQELSANYFVHIGHRRGESCALSNCQQMALKDFMSTGRFDLNTLNVGTYIQTVEQASLSFIKNIIKASSSGICAREYHFMYDFKDDHCQSS